MTTYRPHGQVVRACPPQEHRTDNGSDADEDMFDTPSDRVFFALTHGDPAKKRRLTVMPGAGATLDSKDMAFGLRQVLGHSADGTAIISTRSSQVSRTASLSTVLLRNLISKFEITEVSLQCHLLDQKKLFYIVQGYTDPCHVELSSAMVASSAYAGGPNWFVVADTELQHIDIWQHWQARGNVLTGRDQHINKWQFTRLGMLALQTGAEILSTTSACAVVESISKMSKFGLLKALQNDGWIWKYMPAARQKELPPGSLATKRSSIPQGWF